VTQLAPLERRIAALAARLAPPSEPMTRLEVASRLGLTLDDWQRDALHSEARQLLLNVGRQGGKSTVAALLGLHEALSRPNALVLAVSPGERQSKLLFRKLMGFYRALGKPVPSVVENKLSLELANGSEVHALPGQEDTIRGFSAVTLLLVDEASRVADDLIAAVRPMLAVTGGRLVTMSTPFGKRGWWWDAWETGGSSWERFEVPAIACPLISAAFLEEERCALPPMWFASEYEIDPNVVCAGGLNPNRICQDCTQAPTAAGAFCQATPGTQCCGGDPACFVGIRVEDNQPACLSTGACRPENDPCTTNADCGGALVCAIGVLAPCGCQGTTPTFCGTPSV